MDLDLWILYIIFKIKYTKLNIIIVFVYLLKLERHISAKDY